MHEAGYFMRDIAREVNMSRKTISKYLKPDATAIHGAYGTKKNGGLLVGYTDKINEYISLKFKFKDIEVMIREQAIKGLLAYLENIYQT